MQEEGPRVVNCFCLGERVAGFLGFIGKNMAKINSYRDLEVYKKSYDLALEIHKMTLNFPNFVRMELGSQMRRSSKSIPANTAEGFARRKFKKEYLRYLGMARASIDETRVHLQFSHDLNYISEEQYQYFSGRYEIVGKQLSALINVWLKF